MAGPERSLESDDVNRLLDGAAKVLARTRYCWLSTQDSEQKPTIRPMGILSDEFSNPRWLLRFLADARSRKIRALCAFQRAVITVQSHTEDAFVLLEGSTDILDNPADICRHWRKGFNTYFPTNDDRKSAVFIDVKTDRMELWIRGVTPEPFGMRATVLERQANGIWELRI